MYYTNAFPLASMSMENDRNYPILKFFWTQEKIQKCYLSMTFVMLTLANCLAHGVTT